MVKFAYNNYYQSTIGMAQFKALHGRPCQSPSYWLDNKDPVIVGLELIEQVVKQLELIDKKINDAQDGQKSNVDLKKVATGI